MNLVFSNRISIWASGGTAQGDATLIPERDTSSRSAAAIAPTLVLINPGCETETLGSLRRSSCVFSLEMVTLDLFRDLAILPTLSPYEHAHNGHYVLALLAQGSTFVTLLPAQLQDRKDAQPNNPAAGRVARRSLHRWKRDRRDLRFARQTKSGKTLPSLILSRGHSYLAQRGHSYLAATRSHEALDTEAGLTIL